MSRSPINGDVITFSKGMESLTGIDAGRLRVSFGSKPRLSAKPSAWPVVEEPIPPPCQKEVVLEMQGAQPRVEPEGLQGWAVAGGYVAFGMGMALTNLLSLSYGSQVCSALAPLPMACLLAQAVSAVGLDRRPLCAGGLVLSAWCLPLVCARWTLAWFAPLAIVLAGAQACLGGWAGLLAGLGALGSLGLELLGPYQGVDARWGATLACFCLVVLCAVTASGGRAVFRVRYVL